MLEKREALLIVYGEFRRLTADTILQAFVSNKYWVTSRMPTGWALGMQVLFYQSGAGFTASGSLIGVGASRGEDWQLPYPASISLFPIKLSLDEVDIFPAPVSIRPLLEKLSFVTNKKYWGAAFRRSPRLIPQQDATFILRHVPR